MCLRALPAASSLERRKKTNSKATALITKRAQTIADPAFTKVAPIGTRWRITPLAFLVNRYPPPMRRAANMSVLGSVLILIAIQYYSERF